MDKTIGTLVINIEARLAKLEADLKQAETKNDAATKRMNDAWAKFNTSVASKKINELSALREKMQQRFDKQLKLDVSAGSLDTTRKKLAEIDRQLEGIRKGSEKTGKAGIDLMGVIKGVGVASGITFGAREIVQYTTEAVKLAGEMEGVRIAFNKIDSPNLLENLRGAVKDTVSDLKLMQTAVKANNFKIPMDALIAGLEFAQIRATTTGESIDYMVDSLVTGIGRKSAPILDNLGISMTELQAEIAKVGDFATAAGNIMRRELERSGNIALTTKAKLEQVNAAFTNIQGTIGEIVTGAAGTFLEMVIATESHSLGSGIAWKQINDQVQLAVFFAQQYYDSLKQAVDLSRSQAKDNLEGKNRNEIQKLLNDEIAKKNALLKIKNPTEDQKNDLDQINAKIQIYQDKLTRLTETWNSQNKKVREIEERISLLTEENKNLTTNDQQYKKNLAEINRLQKQIGNDAKQLGEIEQSKLQMQKQIYDALKFQSKDYYDYRAALITKQVEEFRKAGVAEVDVEKWKLLELQKLNREQMQFTIDKVKTPGADFVPVKEKPFVMKPVQVPPFNVETNLQDQITQDLNQVWQEQSAAVSNFGNQLESAFSRSGNSFISKLNQGLQIAINIANAIKASNQPGADPFTSILGIAASFIPGGGFLAGLFGHHGGTFQNGKKIASFAGGGEFTVPAGYGNDSFPMMVESFERVKVTPSSQVGQSEKLLATIVGEMRALVNITASKESTVTVVNNSPDVRTKVKRDGKVQSTMIREGNNLSER